MASKTALVLAGGGARGAYQVGVIRYLREGLPEPARSRVRFDVLAGCSVGAVNACFLAATAHRPKHQGRLLQDYWEALRSEEVYSLSLPDLVRLCVWLLRGQVAATGRRPPRVGLLNSAPLARIVREQFPWVNIEANLAAGLLEAIAISATDIATGRTYVFAQTRDGHIPAWSKDPRRVGVAARIRPDHALASAAIPLLFPPIELDGRLFCDGGLRQMAPISPALRLGADRLLVVSLRHEMVSAEEEAAAQRETLAAYPGAVFLLGKMLNALLLDQLDYDLHSLAIVNSILATGERVYGPGFLGHINEAMATVRGIGYRRAQTLVLRPSRDLGEIAARHATRMRFGRGWARLFKAGLRLAAPSDPKAEGDLLSYLLFDGTYARELAQLGYEDAAARRDELVAFFTPLLDQPEPLRTITRPAG
ncbi:MAG TPA: patatin-like phospholipase family protein [Polyangia bacterium]